MKATKPLLAAPELKYTENRINVSFFWQNFFNLNLNLNKQTYQLQAKVLLKMKSRKSLKRSII